MHSFAMSSFRLTLIPYLIQCLYQTSKFLNFCWILSPPPVSALFTLVGIPTQLLADGHKSGIASAN